MKLTYSVDEYRISNKVLLTNRCNFVVRGYSPGVLYMLVGYWRHGGIPVVGVGEPPVPVERPDVENRV